MRPTDLKFRSPKERTPDPYNPNLSYNGRCLSMPSSSRKQLFAKSKRFIQYDADSTKTCSKVGPGSYLSSTIKNKIKGGAQIKPLIATGNIANNGFIYVGNTLVFDPLILTKRQRKLECVTLNESTRSTVASFKALSSHKSSPRYHHSSSPLKKSFRKYSPSKTKINYISKDNIKTIEKVLKDIEQIDRMDNSRTLGFL